MTQNSNALRPATQNHRKPANNTNYSSLLVVIREGKKHFRCKNYTLQQHRPKYESLLAEMLTVRQRTELKYCYFVLQPNAELKHYNKNVT